MRFKLTLSVDHKINLLPINYQYELSSWIYKTIHQGNSEFSEWLHNKGYQLENKRFKLFTFSRLFIHPRWKAQGDRIAIYSGRASLQLSFYIENAVEHFLIGLFQNQRFSIGDRHSKALFEIQSVERIPDPQLDDEALFRCLSPICLSTTIASQKQPEYLNPDTEIYQQCFFDNLLYKYIAANSPAIDFNTLKSEMMAKTPFHFKSIGNYKSVLIKIKADTDQETFVKGFMYRFKVNAPAELLKLGYQVGFGEKNSMGFGCVKVEEGHTE